MYMYTHAQAYSHKCAHTHSHLFASVHLHVLTHAPTHTNLGTPTRAEMLTLVCTHSGSRCRCASCPRASSHVQCSGLQTSRFPTHTRSLACLATRPAVRLCICLIEWACRHAGRYTCRRTRAHTQTHSRRAQRARVGLSSVCILLLHRTGTP